MEIIFNVYKNKMGDDLAWFLKKQLIYYFLSLFWEMKPIFEKLCCCGNSQCYFFYYIRGLLEVSLKIIRNKMIISFPAWAGKRCEKCQIIALSNVVQWKGKRPSLTDLSLKIWSRSAIPPWCAFPNFQCDVMWAVHNHF